MDELLKQRLMFAIVAANIAIVIFQIAFNSGLFGYPYATYKLLVALVVGLVVGGITFVAVKILQR